MTTNAYQSLENGQRLKQNDSEHCENELKNNNKVNDCNNKTENIVNKNQHANVNSKELNVLYTNVDNLANKVDELNTYIDLYNADIILLTETQPKINNEKYENVFNINGFSCIENNKGRGVCIFYKEHLNINIHDKITELYHPSLFVSLKNHSNTINIGVVYRSPNNDPRDNKKLNNQLNFASKKLNNLIIFGDFNHPSVDWDYKSCSKGEDHPDSLFLFEFIKIKTNQLITKSTHHKPNCKPSLIDLLITKNPD